MSFAPIQPGGTPAARWLGRLTALVVPFVVPVLLAQAAQAGTNTYGGRWHMNETSGSTMKDSSGNGNDGTLSHVTLGVPGFRGTAYSFNGSNSLVTVPSSGSLNPGSKRFTLVVHVKFSVVPPPSVGDYDLIRKGFSGTNGGDYKMEILSTGKASSPDTKPGLHNLADNKWHTIRCIKGNNSEKLVVDGVLQWTQNVTVGSISNTESLTLGGKSTGGDWYNGTMDEVSLVY